MDRTAWPSGDYLVEYIGFNGGILATQLPDAMPLVSQSNLTQAQATGAATGWFGFWRNLALDLIFPPRCAGCGRVDTLWCDLCQHEIDLLPFAPSQQLGEDFALAAIASTGRHEGKLRMAVHSLKFEASPGLALPFGERLFNCLAQQQWSIDILIPVPLHRERQQQRGYNQSQLLCEVLSQHSGLPMDVDTLTRQFPTRPQVGLNAAERRDNVHTAFWADSPSLSQKTILLIDDVYTTGATLDACAWALRSAGAERIYGLTVTSA